MALRCKHKFVSPKEDSDDETLVQPSDWNDVHEITLEGGNLVGRSETGEGSAAEIGLGTGLELAEGKLNLTLPGNLAGRTFSLSNNGLTLETLEINSGLYAGGWRSTGAGGLNWYFVFSAMVLSNQFTREQIRTAVETCLNTSVVAPWEANTAYAANTKVAIDGKIFFVNIPGTTGGSAPDVSGATNSGDFIWDGTIVWEYMGKTVPTEWEWFIIDILNDLSALDDPDSHDAYGGVLASAALKAGVDAAWLAEPTIFTGMNRMELIGKIFDSCVTDTIDSTNLAATFRGEKLGDGTPYPIRFIADNTDAWRGAKALSRLYEIAGDAANSAAALSVADTIKTGIKGLWDPSAGRFRTYYGQTGYENLSGDQAFVDHLRFHSWPILHDMWEDYTEWTTYADPVIGYTIVNTPGLWTGQVDEFAITEWYFMAATKLGLPIARDTLQWRVTTRPLDKVSIIDIALRLELQMVDDDDLLRADAGGTLKAGFTTTSADQGTKSSGTFTPDFAVRNVQHCVNDGAFTLGVPSGHGTLMLDIINGSSAGAIDTAGFDLVTGDEFTTNQGDKFRCFISVGHAGSHLHVVAFQQA